MVSQIARGETPKVPERQALFSRKIPAPFGRINSAQRIVEGRHMIHTSSGWWETVYSDTPDKGV